jgi:predicted DNA-binding transcriptional regulator YafY
MNDPDTWIIEFSYTDSKGKTTRRAVSPIRFLSGDRFLGLCLCREECRQFYLSRCEELILKPAAECLMPIVF